MDGTTGWKERVAACGLDVVVHPEAKIVSPERLSIGNAVVIDDFALLFASEETILEDFVHIAAFALVAGGGRLHVGRYAGISGGARIYTGNDDYLGGSMTGPPVPAPFRVPERSFVNIGRHAVIGANSVILPGVTIGEGAVVGALSLVKSDCEPWTIYGGVPARPLGKRPSQTILTLEKELRAQRYDSDGHYVSKQAR